MTVSADALYERLPAYLREVDETNGSMLRGLLEVLAAPADAVDRDVDLLADGWFVETCLPWLVPYIGDLLGVPAGRDIAGVLSRRAFVANTIGYRRRKGTAAVLERLAHDTTGRAARAVEEFELLVTTQHVQHVRLDAPATVDLRDTDALETVDGPFDRLCHTAEVRRIEAGRGRFNIPNVGIYLWRLPEQPVVGATAWPAAGPPDGFFHVDPLQRDLPLVNTPRPEAGLDDRVEEPHVPGLLRRRSLRDELNDRRAALAAGQPVRPVFFDDQPPLRVQVEATAGAARVEIPPEQLCVCNLTTWKHPPTGLVGFDPVVGRIAFPAGQTPYRVIVDAATASPGPIGAGTYERPDIAALAADGTDWQIGVSRDVAPVPGRIVATLAEAVDAWRHRTSGSRGVIVVMESHRFDEDVTGVARRIQVGEGERLCVIAARWPEVIPPGGGPAQRRVGVIDPIGVRPCLVGDVEIAGTAPDGSLNPGEVVIDGLLIDGTVKVSSPGGVKDLGRLTVSHCSLVPGSGGITVASGNQQLRVVVDRCEVGPITLAADTPSLTVVDSVVDHAGDRAVRADGADVSLDGVTVLGRVAVRTLRASNCLFTERVVVDRRQVGCVRFSYVDPGSATPRRYRCQPDLAVSEAAPGDATVTQGRVVPVFTSTTFGDLAYAQLGPGCAPELVTGADDGAEMGALGFVQDAHRLANLRAALDDYLRAGLEAGVINVT